MAALISEQISARQTGPDEFESVSLPIRMGNARPIAYGGSTMAIAIHAICQTVPTTHKLYSVLGHFHGPANLDHRLKCHVSRTRDTKSFSTRRVQVTQLQHDGSERTVIELTGDFHAVEDPMLVYGAPPRMRYSKPEDCPDRQALQKQMVDAGHITGKVEAAFEAMFRYQEQYYDLRMCPESISGQTLGGTVRGVPTAQDHLPMTDRTSAEWYKIQAHQAPPDDAAQCAAVAFLMDGGLAFLPLVHHGLQIEEVGSWATLDFALRYFRPEVRLQEWHLKERVLQTADFGRSYGEGRLYDEQGRMVASMTQQCILRKPAPRSNL
ncbi:thioesterase family protein [Microdochium nivale]|nr:thioesterase family protein [Microdochium nivale]